jgi:hypothetical protein
VSINLKPEEIEVVRALQNTGVALQEATLAVIMFTRGHARPERELADIISQYPNLEDGRAAQHMITTLVNKGWLVTTESYGQGFSVSTSTIRPDNAALKGL